MYTMKASNMTKLSRGMKYLKLQFPGKTWVEILKVFQSFPLIHRRFESIIR
jgi:hypothetical protein